MKVLKYILYAEYSQQRIKLHDNPHIPSLGIQTPAYAAPIMLCNHNTMTNARYISAMCTSATHNAVHRTTLYAGTTQQCSNSYCTHNNLYCALLCYKSIAIYSMHSCPIRSVGDWSQTSSGCLTSKRQCPSTPHQHPRS